MPYFPLSIYGRTQINRNVVSFSIQDRFDSYDVQWVYRTVKGSDFVGTFR